ncbi:MAG: hypothetical protein KAS77_13720 [Thermoplasmata archaeon]|nr:hypothetical protein [Thermoplasmata archaeon]
MAKSRISEFLDLWNVKERKLLYIYLGILFFFWGVAIATALWTNDWSAWTFGSNVLSGVLFASLFAGFVFTRRFWGKGIVPARRMINMMLKLSVVVGLILMMIFTILMAYYPQEAFDEDPSEPFSNAEWFGMMVALFILGFLAGFLAFLFYLVVAMGFVGALVMFEVGVTPVVIRRVRGITTSEERESRILAWFLLIPENLDTGTLSAARPVEEKAFPWSRFYHAISWQIMISLLIAVSLSLNPFIKDTIDPSQILSLLTNANIIVPLIILPSLIYLRLKVRIEGPAKEFRVYKGMQSRLIRTFFAAGTIIIILRLAVKEVTSQDFLLSFAGYAAISVSIIVFFTWIYYNFFENFAAFRVAERIPELMKGEEEGDEKRDEDGKGDMDEDRDIPAEGKGTGSPGKDSLET